MASNGDHRKQLQGVTVVVFILDGSPRHIRPKRIQPALVRCFDGRGYGKLRHEGHCITIPFGG